MTLIWGDGVHQGPRKTHILIIGVGAYDYLAGGEREHEIAELAALPPLGQLTSPTVSARAVADFFLSGDFNNPEAPLGSIEMLLSDAHSRIYQAPDGNTMSVDPANLANIKDSFAQWVARCQAQKDNVAFFYFCGHGLQANEFLILPGDFGESKYNPWDTAINFDATYRGMECLLEPTAQIFVLDACRQWTDDMLRQAVDARSLMQYSFDRTQDRSAEKIFATKTGAAAFGDTGKTSRMTRALIKSLKGSAAEFDENDQAWKINSEKLGTTVRDLVNWENRWTENAAQHQNVDPAGGARARGPHILNEPTHPPEVLVELESVPRPPPVGRCFYYRASQGQAQQCQAQDGAGDPWKVTFGLQAGAYEFGLQLEDQALKPIFAGRQLRPPVTTVIMKVSP